MEITTTLCRYDAVTGEESEIDLIVEGEYEGEVPDEPWGYYGATPGSAEDAYITSIKVEVEVAGPHKNPYLRHKGLLSAEWYARMAASWTCPEGPVTYRMPWEGTLTKDEEAAICGELVEAAREEIASAREDAAVAAYEASRDY